VQADIYLRKYLSSLISNPERVSVDDIPLLKDSVEKYPYFQALHLLLAKASIGRPEEAEQLATTALYTNGSILHQFVSSQPLVSRQSLNATQVSVEGHPDEQETFDEISELNFHDYVSKEEPKALAEATPLAVPAAAPQIETLEDDFVLENIVATDFFAFEKNFSTDSVPVELAQEEEVVSPPARESRLAASVQASAAMALQTTPPARNGSYDTGRETNEVTNYDDDTLPYTFLWWLAKTRREHRSIFQPYVSQKSTNPNELQQQYVEHIFHIQSPFNAEEILNNAPVVRGDPKDLEIIDQFIKNAPQISAPRPEQIDNENKAKKSAEDHNDLVSETLAKIYIEQMLYHKAIETYEKLSLKFPEKSRYFADLIQSIQKKI
jgi:hypothetical protein